MVPSEESSQPLGVTFYLLILLVKYKSLQRDFLRNLSNYFTNTSSWDIWAIISQIFQAFFSRGKVSWFLLVTYPKISSGILSEILPFFQRFLKGYFRKSSISTSGISTWITLTIFLWQVSSYANFLVGLPAIFIWILSIIH